MGEGKIIILVKDGKIAMNRKFDNINNLELSIILSNLDLLKLDLLSDYKDSIQTIYDGKK